MSQIKPSGQVRQKQPRTKNEGHLKAIRQCNCLACGKFRPSEAAHIRYGDMSVGKFATGMQEKPHDKWVTPLCSGCHEKQHTMNEKEFWKQNGIDPIEIARKLFGAKNDVETMQDIVSDDFI